MIERTHKDKIKQYSVKKLRRLFQHNAKREIEKWRDGPFKYYRWDDRDEFRFRLKRIPTLHV